MPIPSDIVDEYSFPYEPVKNEKDQYSLHDRENRIHRSSVVVKSFKLDRFNAPKHILDVGCGAGELSRMLLDLGHSVVSTNAMGWSDRATTHYNGAISELAYNNINPKFYEFHDGSSPTEYLNSESLTDLKALSTKKYDVVLAIRSSMHQEHHMFRDRVQDSLADD